MQLLNFSYFQAPIISSLLGPNNLSSPWSQILSIYVIPVRETPKLYAHIKQVKPYLSGESWAGGEV